MNSQKQIKNECPGRAIAIVGLQFGSEGKGKVSAYVSHHAIACVRIGAANAGHTIYYRNQSFTMRHIPCGWVSSSTQLVIGLTAIVSLSVLLAEIERIHAVLPIKHRLFIDPRVLVITDDQILREAQSTLASDIASTSARAGLGIGTALSDKIMRDKCCMFAADVVALQSYICNTTALLNGYLEDDQIIVFEGTQGFGLSIDHGYWPYTTSRDTTAQSLFAGTGVNPYPFDIEVIGVARTYPIRVAGNSGPFDPDSIEIDWKQLQLRSGSDCDITEKTSVTHMVRRVATFSESGIIRACTVNRVSEIALMFMDHIDADVLESEHLTTPCYDFVERVESITGIPVGLISTGPKILIDRDPYRASMIRKVRED